ncbi:MAG: APC family permease [Coriobacteriales bacterium]|nr:APC family permease [Coriobacteriales bacterium]
MTGIHSLKKVNISAFGIAIVLYCLVASGAFGIEEIIPLVGPGMTIILLAIFPLIWGLPISNLVAECNAIMPAEGGVQTWARAALGEFWGYQVGWWAIVSTYISSGEYVALAAGYADQLFGLDATGSFLIKIAMIALFTIINLLGFKEVEKSDAVLSLIIVVVFALVTVIGFGSWQTNPMEPVLAPEIVPSDIAEGMLLCVWMYCGFECIAAMGGEIKNPGAVSKGLKIALPLIALSYILPTFAGIAALPEGSWVDWGVDGGMTEETLGYASVLEQSFPGFGALLFLPVAIFSECAIYNTYLASGSRNLFVLAEDNLFPKGVAKLTSRSRVPYVAILTITLSSIILSQLEFTVLVELESVFILATYVVLSITVMRFRKMYPVEQRSKAVKEGTIGGGKFGLMWCVLLPIIISFVAFMLNDLEYLLYSIIALGSGIVAYVICKHVYGGRDAKSFAERVAEEIGDEPSAPVTEAVIAQDGIAAGTEATAGEILVGTMLTDVVGSTSVGEAKPAEEAPKEAAKHRLTRHPLNPDDGGQIALFVGILVLLAFLGLAASLI